MGKVQIDPEFQAESTRRENIPANVVAEVMDLHYEKIKKEAYTNPKNGEVIGESEKTYAILQLRIPDSTDPNKLYRHELGVGEVLIPGPDGTYLDDAMATTEKGKLLGANSGFANFTRSLRMVGAESGIYTAKEGAAVADNSKALIGTKFLTGYAEKEGGPTIGKYSTLIALQVINFGKVDIGADMDAVVSAIKAVVAQAPVGGLKGAEVVGKLGSLTGAQFELAKQSFASEDWLKTVEATGQVFKRTPQGLFVKA